MAERFMLAVRAAQEMDPRQLGRWLCNAAQEVMDEGGVGPHMDPACRMIAFQIAFACNGDLSRPGYYEELYQYCVLRANHGPNADFPQEFKDVKPPVCEAS